ncbi:MAG: type III pantothenate kinase [Desulfofustis sp.]|nr:type III pantothenate kinase [Desulfofustis sp.]
MYFVIDIGNTHTVAGLFDQFTLLRQWRIKTDSAMTSDEIAITYHNLFTMAGIDSSRIDGVIMSSVVPQLDGAYVSCCHAMFGDETRPLLFNIDNQVVADLITIKLDNPAEVGADRLVNSIAAHHLCQSSAIVIDFGTAITFDCVSEQCEYLGGLILPGMSISIGALAQKTAKLPQIDLSSPAEQVIGTTTVSAMKSGMVHGYGAMIEGLIAKVRQEMQQRGYRDIEIMATGGMSRIIRPYTPSIKRHEPNLTLDGLALIYQRLTAVS